jgi:hypothetical protein
LFETVLSFNSVKTLTGRFAELVGKYADVGFVCISLHPFRNEIKFLKMCGWGFKSQSFGVKFGAA